MAKRTQKKAGKSGAKETTRSGHKETPGRDSRGPIKAQKPDTMKNCFLPFTLTEDGELVPHDHPILEGKEFVNPSSCVQVIQDYLRETPVKDQDPVGSVVLLNLIQF